jgi:hypothetical protein
VAVDAYGASLFELGPEQVGFLRWGGEAGLGAPDWRSLPLFKDQL